MTRVTSYEKFWATYYEPIILVHGNESISSFSSDTAPLHELFVRKIKNIGKSVIRVITWVGSWLLWLLFLGTGYDKRLTKAIKTGRETEGSGRERLGACWTFFRTGAKPDGEDSSDISSGAENVILSSLQLALSKLQQNKGSTTELAKRNPGFFLMFAGILAMVGRTIDSVVWLVWGGTTTTRGTRVST